MKAYELLFFVAPTISDETRLAVMKRIEATIAEGEGKIDNVEDWGKRKLAYEINGLTEGDYTPHRFPRRPRQHRGARSRAAHHRRGGPPQDRCSHRPRVISVNQ